MHLVGLIYHLQKLHWCVVYKIGYRARLLFLLWILQEGNPNSQTVGSVSLSPSTQPATRVK